MRAWRIHRHGGPEVMRLEEVARPEGAQVVRLRAASVNPVDWKMREGIVPVALPRILGRDGAGTCSGARVMGVGERGQDGTHAEYAAFAPEASAGIPAGVSFEEAAALGIAGLSAWIALVETARVRAGERVLVHGGAGGVGSLAIQIARLRGAEAWTTCSARNAAWCRALGARETIDYVKDDFTSAGRLFDVVLDTQGGAVHRRSAEVLKPGGALVCLNAAPVEPVARDDVRVLHCVVEASRATLETLLALAVEGKLTVPVEARFPLERAAEAYELSRGGRARGKIVLQM